MTTPDDITPCNQACTTRLSDSALWSLSAEYYQHAGLAAWESGTVPYYITSNSFIAHTYARMICETVEDMVVQGSVDVNAPVYVIELGAGLGLFGYLCARALQRFQDKEYAQSTWKVTYVLTDLHEESVHHWAEHPKFEDLKGRNLVDFAALDANEAINSIHLLHRDVIIDNQKKKATNPLVLVANYVFDSIPMDAFRMVGEKLYEEQAQLVSKDGKDLDPQSPDWLDNLDTDNMWHLQEVSDEDINMYYYNEQWPDLSLALKRILRWYKEYFACHEANFEVDEFAEYSTSLSQDSSQIDDQVNETDGIPGKDKVDKESDSADSPPKEYQSCSSASFLIPLGGFRLLMGFRSLTCGHVMLILGDKGNSNPECFYGLGVPHIAAHGSVSFMVNQHALGLFSQQLGGFTLHCERQDADLGVSVSIFPQSPKSIGVHNQTKSQRQNPYESYGKNSSPLKSALFALANSESNYMLEKPDVGFPFDNSRGWKLIHDLPKIIKNCHQMAVERSKLFPRLVRIFSDIERFGPDDFYRLQHGWKNCSKETSVKAISARLDLSYWDVETFIMHMHALEKRISVVRHHVKEDICRVLPKVVENWIKMTDTLSIKKTSENPQEGAEGSILDQEGLTAGQAQEKIDVPFEVAWLFHRLDKAHVALYYYAESWENVEENAVTAHNIGLCLYDLDQLCESMEWFEKAVALDPHYVNAHNWISKLKSKINNQTRWRKISSMSSDEDEDGDNGLDALSDVSPTPATSPTHNPRGGYEWRFGEENVRFDIPKQ